MSSATGDSDEPGNEITDFARMVARISRLLTRLSGLPVFKNAGLGLAEWIALSILAEEDHISNKQLAKKLGVTGQRANQICNSLAAANLIKVSQSAEDTRRNVIELMELGRGKLIHVNMELTKIVGRSKLEKELITRTSRGAHLVIRLLNTSSEEQA
jgi:DNA-binding MarR family transcriptional regulator